MCSIVVSSITSQGKNDNRLQKLFCNFLCFWLKNARADGIMGMCVREGVKCVSGSKDEQNDGMAICAVREKATHAKRKRIADENED